MTSLRTRTAAGVIWNSLERFSKLGLGFVITLLLAAFLDPADMGLIAMIGIFLMLGTTLSDSGFGEALVRKQEAEQVDFSTAFYTNVGIGLALYGLIFLAAPAIAAFYDEPRLVVATRVASLTIVINAFQTVPRAVLSRRLDFKMQLYATLPATVASGALALAMAWAGYRYWALIAQMIVFSLLNVAVLWVRSGWRPVGGWSMASFRSQAGFGSRMTASTLLHVAADNVVIVIIGHAFAATTAGLYLFADRIQRILTHQLVGAVQKVTFPALSAIQDDKERLVRGFRKVVKIVTFVVYPALIGTILTADLFFDAFLPDRWHGAVLPTRGLCLAGLIFPLTAINLNLLKLYASGRAYLGLDLFRAALLLVAVLAGSAYGLEGILVALIAVSVIGFLPGAVIVARATGYRLGRQFRDIVPTLALSIGAAGVALPVRWAIELPAVLMLAVTGLAMAAAYGLGALAFRLEAADELLRLVGAGRVRRGPVTT